MRSDLEIEGELDSRTAVGMSFSYTNASGSTTGGQYARADLFQTSAYGKIALAGPLTFDVQASLGFLDTATRRSVSLVGTPFTLRGHESSLTYSTQLGLGYDISVGGGLKITPRAAQDLVAELGLREATGRGRYRAWGIL